MQLKWKHETLQSKTDITPDNISEISQNNEHINHIEAAVGILELTVWRGRKYKDGTFQWLIYLTCPIATSKEIITLTRTRGLLPDAIKTAEEFILQKPFPTKS